MSEPRHAADDPNAATPGVTPRTVVAPARGMGGEEETQDGAILATLEALINP